MLWLSLSLAARASALVAEVKLGLVAATSSGNCMYMGGRFGGLRAGGVMGILLSNPADSAVGLCGCEAVGPFWEVFDYDSSPRSSVIKTVSDPQSSKLDGDGRRLAMTMAEAISELEEDLGRTLRIEDLWVGIRRGNARATRVEASSSGEWALLLGRFQLNRTSQDISLIVCFCMFFSCDLCFVVYLSVSRKPRTDPRLRECVKSSVFG